MSVAKVRPGEMYSYLPFEFYSFFVYLDPLGEPENAWQFIPEFDSTIVVQLFSHPYAIDAHAAHELHRQTIVPVI